MKAIHLYVDELEESQSFSGVIQLDVGGETRLQRAMGWALRGERIPNRLGTRFQMASGSKIFTSVAIGQLVDAGRLSFDATLEACLDVDFAHFDPKISVHQLLTHSSGITSYFEEDVDDDYEKLWRETPVYRMRSPKHFLPLFQHKPMKFQPGTRFEYNDGGFILLGLILEAATGETFDRYVAREVIAKAEMKDSGYFAADQLPGNTARAYISDPDGGWRSNVFAVPIIGGPDGGAYTTAADMARFWDALHQGRLLSEATLAQVLRPHLIVPEEGEGVAYGYGVWMRRTPAGEREYYVEGWDPGVAFISGFDPKHQRVLSVISNVNMNVWKIYAAILKHLDA